MKQTGAEIIVRSLQEEGVRFIFGYPGGAVLHIYDALFQINAAEPSREIRHILVRHEQAAVHAADGYARVSGEVGVALVTSGPGATNAVTGIATAYMDSIPVVIISGQVPTQAIGQDAFQEVDTVGITRPCVKHNFLVKSVDALAETVKKAFHIARTGRPGPVLIDVPKDVTIQTAEFNYPKSITLRSYNPVLRGHLGQIRKAAKTLLMAKRPIIYSGGGVILGNAAPELRALVKKLDFPVTQTLMGLGAIPGTDHHFLGMPGMHGTYEANLALHYSDCILAIGTRFDDRVVGNVEHFLQEPRTIIHIDIDPSSISKRVPIDIPIVGHVKSVLADLLTVLDELGGQPDREAIAAWWRKINEWRAKQCLAYQQDGNAIKPQMVIETLWKLTNEKNVVITSDVGQHQMWTAQYYKFNEPRRWLSSGGLGTMGVGLPYAMGAKLAKPEATVICVTGEASIQMCIQELSTCKQFRLPIKIINLNNRYLGMVRQWQELFHGGRYSESYMDSLPDFSALARAYGHIGIRVDHPHEVESAIKAALYDYPNELVFLDIQIDPRENVFPMVQGGKGLTEMILGAEEL